MLEVTFNGTTLAPPVYVEDVRRAILPRIVHNTAQIPGRIGAYFGGRTVDERIIEIDLRLITPPGETEWARLSNLAAVLFTDEPKRLEISDRPGVYELAMVDGSPSWDVFAYTGSATLTFHNYDGVYHASDVTIGTTNSGTVQTPFIMRGTSTAEAITVLSDRTGELLSFNGVPIGATVEIDTGAETITVNGVLGMQYDLAISDYPWLQPGANTMTVSGLSDVTYEHRARFL